MFTHSPSLADQLQTAWRDKGSDYQPRTRYLDDSGQPRYINRLILEDSPYLLQHAHNPVDWFPWGEEAFAVAAQQNKPVFLSIGYSTCHWCHVMEEESFDNEEIAQVLNQYFISIKVDRELHPDVDSYYMSAVMIMQGQGGWPMSSFLTPDRKPFFGATYFRPGQFLTLMHRVNELWQQQHSDLLEQARHFSEQVAGTMAARQSLNEIGINVVDLTAQALMNHHDPQHGGFGQAPKFPNEPYLYFLLDYAVFKQDKTILDAVTRTLHIQSCGGIYDHVAGGFHRYATDVQWLVPHFEKMLYNQANLSCIFARAWTLTRARDFKRVAEETLDYVLREMTNPEGGFYSATDADSEGEEGLFFIWDKTEIESLPGEDADLFVELYQITAAGNFEGKNIPSLDQPLEQYADNNAVDYDELIEQLARCKTRLLELRNKRVPPLRDDKVITAWNGMMIKAFAYAGQVLQREDYVTAACQAASYVLSTNVTSNGMLSRSSLAGKASIPALQEDYAYLAESLLAVYDATRNQQWLRQATALTEDMLERFWDEDAGGFYMSSPGTDNLLPVAPKEAKDNATASGNSVALKLLSRLWRRNGQLQYQAYAQQLVRGFSDDITQRPYVCSYMIDGLLELIAGEQGPAQWCCDGNVLVHAQTRSIDETIEIGLSISIADGWHLNAQSDDGHAEIPLVVELNEPWLLLELQAGPANSKQLGYQTDPVQVYDGNQQLILKTQRRNQADTGLDYSQIKLKLTLQCCNDEKCLAPVSINLALPL